MTTEEIAKLARELAKKAMERFRSTSSEALVDLFAADFEPILTASLAAREEEYERLRDELQQLRDDIADAAAERRFYDQ